MANKKCLEKKTVEKEVEKSSASIKEISNKSRISPANTAQNTAEFGGD